VLLILGAVAVGILGGLALGGSLRTLSEAHFRWWPLALLGLALQFVPVPSGAGRIDEWLDVGLLVLSYASLLSFLALNIRQGGFPLVAAGIALNALVIAINGGMPVSDDALRQAYGAGYREIRQVLVEEGPPKHHLADPGEDVLLPLADVIAIGSPINNVFSWGDVAAMVGIVWVLAAATKGRPGKHRGREGRWSSREEREGTLKSGWAGRRREVARPLPQPQTGPAFHRDGPEVSAFGSRRSRDGTGPPSGPPEA
jgi:hypothetical protein